MSYKTMSIRKPTWDPTAAMAAASAQRQRCEAGDHALVEAKAGKVTYVAGQRVTPGTRYCSYCAALSPSDGTEQ